MITSLSFDLSGGSGFPSSLSGIPSLKLSDGSGSSSLKLFGGSCSCKSYISCKSCISSESSSPNLNRLFQLVCRVVLFI